MDDQSRDCNRIELSRSRQIEVPQTFPHRLLHAARDPKRRQVVRDGWIRKIAGDAQLEVALSERFGITLTQTGFREISAQLCDVRTGLPSVELGLELAAVLAVDRRGVDPDEAMGTMCGEPRG